jgi:tetratricopeptide (TPR) repeat protein
MKNYYYLFLIFTSTLFAQKDSLKIEDKSFEDYKNADLKTKFEMNEKYAANEVLPILSSYQTIVDDKFLGVKNFGSLVAKTDFNLQQDINKLTSNNSDYWRATMEMESRNELIPTTKIFMLVSQGEFDYALKYMEIVKLISKDDNYANAHLSNLEKRLELFNNLLNSEIQKGIVEHDKGEFEKAIAIYKKILVDYPNSAWANFELFYSQFALNSKTGRKELNTFESWGKTKTNVFDHNPLYNVQMSAKDGKEGYQIYRRNSINKLFKDSKNKLEDIYEYADIAMDLQAYDFAAQLFWYTASYMKIETSIYKYFYCLEKLGIKDLKDNFKGDFEKEFSKIEKEKEKEMTKSQVYKSYKN